MIKSPIRNISADINTQPPVNAVCAVLLQGMKCRYALDARRESCAEEDNERMREIRIFSLDSAVQTDIVELTKEEIIIWED